MSHEENKCPHCKGDDINFDTFEMIDGNQGYFLGECNDCGTTFKEWHLLKFSEITDIYIPKEEKDGE